MYKDLIKPFLDVVSSVIIFFILSPVYLLLMAVLALSFKENPFFVQERVGRNDRVFKIFKFKTMNNKRDEQGNLLPDEVRLTHVGRFVRKTSLDEIPQLINVLKGDMSIVGPRPLLVSYLAFYDEEQKKRHLVKPGITGWVGVNGRNALSWEEKFKLDVWYVEHQSFLLDLKILFKTVKKVLVSDGITDAVNATTTSFHGNTKK